MNQETAGGLPPPLKKFYQGEPLALGITQILIGIIGMAFAITGNMADSYYRIIYLIVMTPYWTGVLYIISGSLSVAAARNPKPSLVKGMLGMNVVSAVATGIAIVFLSFSLLHHTYYYRNQCSRYSSSSDVDPACYENEILPYKKLVGMMAVLLVFNILEFCISISNAAFGCKNDCLETPTQMVVVVYQNATPDPAVGLQTARLDPESP
ncbi:membrane-spanning 4-domains subfamily A member 4A-like [Hemicordylus capensis]|uniref:membrane-spanning 4-domains subfamily A member 4A-like n=1 Tax=Hemicordylus capensis TaxID=884348 RepID=UPI002304B97D|nr:membrane-spanning 4-domains subfamily A member 4A-like [Hemicordylus capensis]XP_053122712.1 membrane-spanning 4-domains subfamily A member 4A-like [Hemicordylus capensis]XP_053122713.1 membrane-spanning 4-domains subfamily A member 4A-like [Hemicordylus capensis]